MAGAFDFAPGQEDEGDSVGVLSPGSSMSLFWCCERARLAFPFVPRRRNCADIEGNARTPHRIGLTWRNGRLSR